MHEDPKVAALQRLARVSNNAMYGHTSEDTAYVVDDYPYGYTLRTQIRYWLETTNHGDRFVSQTLNPKTGRWNKPKKSTYVEVGLMFRDPESGHIEWTGARHHADNDWLHIFIEITRGKLSDRQKTKLAEIIGMKRAFEGVTFSVRAGNYPVTVEETERQRKTDALIARRIEIETGNAAKDL